MKVKELFSVVSTQDVAQKVCYFRVYERTGRKSFVMDEKSSAILFKQENFNNLQVLSTCFIFNDYEKVMECIIKVEIEVEKLHEIIIDSDKLYCDAIKRLEEFPSWMS